MLSTTIPLLLLAARSVYATGCATHTFGHCEDGITHWYDPDDFQICDPLDCGGGRAPPKTNNPCCGGYTGTEACVQTPSYMSCLVAKATATATASATGAEDRSTSDVYQVATTTPTQAPVAIITSSFPVSPMPTSTEAGSTSEASISGATTPVASVTTSTRPVEGSTSASNGGGTSTSSSGSVPVSTNAAGGRSQYELIAVAGAAVAGVLAMA